MKRIDKKEALRLLKKVVEKEGTHRRIPDANDCVYFQVDEDEDGDSQPSWRPSCLIGHVAVMSGNREFQDLLRTNNDEYLAEVGGAEKFLSLGAFMVLGEAQNVQDRRKTWGEALKEARQV